MIFLNFCSLIPKKKSIVFAVVLATLAHVSIADTDESWKTPEFIAERKTSLHYKHFIEDFLRTPEFNPHNLAFRIRNNIEQAGKGHNLEFYLMAVLHRDWVEITYPEKKSIHDQLYDYFLQNPDVGFDNFHFQPKVIKKQISYGECPELKNPIYTMENYIKTSLMSKVSHKFSDNTYTLGYTNFDFDIVYESNNIQELPFSDLIKIQKIATKCAKNLPTVEEKARLQEIERRKNYKGKIFDSPPHIALKIGEKSYNSVIGTFCWPIDTHAFCSDSFAHITNKEPISVKRGSTLSFSIPEEQELDYIEYAIARVSPSDLSKEFEEQDDFLAWNKNLKSIKSSADNLRKITFDKRKGKYIVIIFGQWGLYGDAVHGFYLSIE